MERTLIILKPDAVQRGLIGDILARFERRGLRIVAMKLMQVDQATAERHYAVHKGKPFYPGLVNYITSAPVVVLVLEGPNVISIVRTMVGSTRPGEAAPGTIRGDYGLTVDRNLIHASDAPETAAYEIGIYFGEQDLLNYRRDMDRWIVPE